AIGADPAAPHQETVDFVRDNQLFEGSVLGSQALDQVDGLREGNIAVVIAVNQEHRGFPGAHVGVGGRFPGQLYGRLFVGRFGGNAAEVGAFGEEDAPVVYAVEIHARFEEIGIPGQTHGGEEPSVGSAPQANSARVNF